MDVMEDREGLIISRMETVLNRPLAPEEQEELKMWDRGRVLAQIVHTDAWAILLDSIRSYVEQANEDLTNLAPGDVNVPVAHAVAFALKDFYRKFQQDVQKAIETSLQQPQVLREAGKVHTPAPPDSM